MVLNELKITDDLSIIINKVNQNFNQLLSLNGGPMGKIGLQGIPGLPGLPGDKGDPGENGEDGSMIYLVNANPLDNNILIVPDENDLEQLINDGVYNVGDIFVSKDVLTNKIIFYKIIQNNTSPISYSYSIFEYAENPNYNTLWVRHYDNYIYNNKLSLIINKTTSLDSTFNDIFDNTDNDNRNRFLSNILISANDDTEDTNNIFYNLYYNTSSIKPLLFWDRKYFKLSIDQKPTFNLDTISKDDFLKIIDIHKGLYNITNQHQYLNFWDSVQYNNDIIDFNNIPDNLNINQFNILKNTTPILYLQTCQSYMSDDVFELNDDDKYTNFGFLIKRIKNNNIIDNSYKSVLILASDKNNDVYIEPKNIWGNNFISEINNQNSDDNERFYTLFLSKTNIGTMTGVYRATVNFGIGDYYKYVHGYIDNNIDYNRKFDLESGIQIRNIFSLDGLYSSLNLYLTQNILDDGNLFRNKNIICRITSDGSVLFKKDIEGTYDDDIIVGSRFHSKFTIDDSAIIDRQPSILKLIANKSHFDFTNISDTNDIMLQLVSSNNYNNFENKFIGINIKKIVNGNLIPIFSILNYYSNNIGNTLHTDIYNKGRLNFKYITDNNIKGDIMFSNDLYCIGGIKTKNYSNSELIDSFAWLTKGKQYNEFDPIGNPSHDNVILYILGGHYNNTNIRGGKTIQIKDGTEGDRKVLTSDANGVASWDYINYGTGTINFIDLSVADNFAMQTKIGYFDDDYWYLDDNNGGTFIIDKFVGNTLQRNINIVLPYGDILEDINMAEYTFRIGNIYDNTVSVNIFVRVMGDKTYSDNDILFLTEDEKSYLTQSSGKFLTFTVKYSSGYWFVLKREFITSINKVPAYSNK